MPIINYVAKDFTGEYHRGEIETADVHEAGRLLQRKKLIVISLKVASQNNTQFLERYFSQVSFTDLVIFTRQLATMIEAGLVLSDAITALADQQEQQRERQKSQAS